jgi:hypothetical protein
MENLRNAAQEVQGTAVVAHAPFVDEATLVPPTRDDSGW